MIVADKRGSQVLQTPRWRRGEGGLCPGVRLCVLQGITSHWSWRVTTLFQESIEDLVETLYLLSSDATQILLAYEERDSEIKLEVMKMFFEQMKSRFIWRKIPHSEHHQDFESPDIQIFNFTLSK